MCEPSNPSQPPLLDLSQLNLSQMDTARSSKTNLSSTIKVSEKYFIPLLATAACGIAYAKYSSQTLHKKQVFCLLCSSAILVYLVACRMIKFIVSRFTLTDENQHTFLIKTAQNIFEKHKIEDVFNLITKVSLKYNCLPDDYIDNERIIINELVKRIANVIVDVLDKKSLELSYFEWTPLKGKYRFEESDSLRIMALMSLARKVNKETRDYIYRQYIEKMKTINADLTTLMIGCMHFNASLHVQKEQRRLLLKTCAQEDLSRLSTQNTPEELQATIERICRYFIHLEHMQQKHDSTFYNEIVSTFKIRLQENFTLLSNQNIQEELLDATTQRILIYARYIEEMQKRQDTHDNIYQKTLKDLVCFFSNHPGQSNIYRAIALTMYITDKDLQAHILGTLPKDSDTQNHLKFAIARHKQELILVQGQYKKYETYETIRGALDSFLGHFWFYPWEHYQESLSTLYEIEMVPQDHPTLLPVLHVLDPVRTLQRAM